MFKNIIARNKKLVAVALGQEQADLVIKNITLVNVCTCEYQEHMNVLISGDRIAAVSEDLPEMSPETKIIDGTGKYLCPGFLDGHIHVESSMLTVGNYAKAVIPHGTTGIYMDPHEIANVLGLEGVRYMLDDAKTSPLKVMLTTPSCVPAIEHFEDSGAILKASDVSETMTWPETVGLGEMMNFPGVLEGNNHVHEEIAATLAAEKVVTGHYSIPDTGFGLSAYIATGIRCCHESNRAEDALAKMRLGMYAMLREGSAWRDLEEVSKAITEHQIDSRFGCLVSDDTHPHTLIEDGHLDHIIRRAIACGIDVLTAIQMVTINVATCFRMDHELGSVTPGKKADMVLLNDLESVQVDEVIIDGELVAEKGQMLAEISAYDYPPKAQHTMHIEPLTNNEAFQIYAKDPEATESRVRVIRIVPERVFNQEVILNIPVRKGCLEADPTQDVLKACVFNRHHKDGGHALGFVQGFGITDGAMASTVAHDAHNLLVLGANDEDMKVAANTLINSGGGMCIVKNKKVLGHVPLPIAGLMSQRAAKDVAEDVANMEAAWREMGANMASPFMTMALISLACLPDLRLTNRGLVDCNRFIFVPLEVE